MSEPANPAITRARELVLAHGWNSTSFQIVNPGIRRWFSDSGDAVVGYVDSRATRVVVGAPVCEKNRLSDIVSEFESLTADSGEHVCYFAAESRLESLFLGSNTHARILLGAQPVWDPRDWANIVGRQRSIRSQVNRARNKGVRVEEWPIEKAGENPELAACLRQWLGSKGLPPLHFMVEPDTLSRLDDRRVFVATRDEKVVGFIVLSPVSKRNGWLFEQFPHSADAPNGTVELMIDSAMRVLGSEGFEYATLGLSPLSKRAEIDPFDNPFWLRVLLSMAAKTRPAIL
ncbi:MAG: DUF2156 domain-containing protein [Pyrinomonadaceae bacterium]